jgi:hypothetical protein
MLSHVSIYFPLSCPGEQKQPVNKYNFQISGKSVFIGLLSFLNKRNYVHVITMLSVYPIFQLLNHWTNFLI